MAPVCVSVQSVSKKYRLFNSPKERLLEAMHPFKKKYHREFWALRDIELDIPKGTTIGIIGKNGSGKSTLLQIICSVLTPTCGTVETEGRISALLALGAGFNPEFTGRDNVLLSGALMGFSKAEMKERMSTIEAFADIGDFVDQPMKIYSSGMSLRLAFAAAINVEPDIMVVDEALAVGDAKFQHKCYQKFLEFQKAGKTIIIVTHDINAVIKHCDQAVLLDKGRIVAEGEPATIVNYYTDLLFTGKFSNYSAQPHLLESGYRDFNIVHYKDKYYGFLAALGQINLDSIGPEQIQKYVEEGKCVTAATVELAKQHVDELADRSGTIADSSGLTVEGETGLGRFLKDTGAADNCVNRKSYNKNEYRFGDRRAEIVDYLVVSDGNSDLVMLKSGVTVDIYLKVRVHQSVECPMFGFSIKSVDGVAIYASNTRYSKISVDPVVENEIVVFKFSMRLVLNVGDFFVDLGFAEELPGEDTPIDIRYSIVHLVVQPRDCAFDGFADFGCTCQEVSRTAIG